MAKLHCKF